MAYTKSDTTPGVHQNLEQRLDWIEDGLANDAGATNDATVYVVAPTGVAATDTAAIQGAHDALPSTGGLVQLGRGTYVIDPSTSLVFTKPIALIGHGRGATTLTIDSANANLISSAASKCIFKDFTLTNNHVTAPTAGAAILIGTTGGGNRNQFIGLEINSFYYGIQIQYGNGWLADNCFINDYKLYGIWIQNLDNTDSGDGSIVNSQIATNVAALTYGIHWSSGGAFRAINNQLFSGAAAGNGNQGIAIRPLDGVNTSEIILVGNIVENFDFPIAAGSPGSHTGQVQGVVVQGNAIFVNSNGTGISFMLPATNLFSEIIIGGNRVSSGSYGVRFGDVDLITVGPNQYKGQTTAGYNDALTSTNVTKVANG